ncbi:MAG: redoxin domain-containing protein [Candidatus Micrarchaeaceae archaeon]|jgi:thiol-disulfide isomerase/thioredoxin
MKTNTYIIVFGIIAVIIAAALLSTLVFNKNLSAKSSVPLNLTNYGPAPNLQGIAGWINSQPLNLTQLRGKVVLIDFWTYSCINCIRTIPHLNSWYNEYGNNGLVIIGVSTPEFEFEHNYTNVKNAVEKFGIEYPVALDNNYSTWDAYQNQYWPADYLIDKNGDVRYVSFGEGNYNETEMAIRELLQNAGYVVPSNMTNVASAVNFSGIGTPELYLGYARERQPLGNSQGFVPNSTVNYTITGTLQNNTAYLQGQWYNAPDSMIAVNNSDIFLVYKAKNVNVVASGNNGANTSLVIKLDGKNLSSSDLGADDHLSGNEAVANVSTSRLYNIVAAQSYGWHTLEIEANPNFRIFTFTFG